ncbi:MAG TPA: endonuclease domain-containing protein [Rhizomicrobium sp.]|jgi:very-short-patch-repair endonuclease
MRNRVKRDTLANAREMRAAPTAFEKRLWNALRELNDEGYHFRRQVPFRGFILDFSEHRAKLAIELDGSSHQTPTRRKLDARRDAVLEKEGYLVLRIENGEIAETLDPVLQEIRRALKVRADLPPTRNAARSDLPTRGRFVWSR